MKNQLIRVLLATSLAAGCSSSESATPEGAGGAGAAGETSTAGSAGDKGVAGETGAAGAAGVASAPLTGTITLRLKEANAATGAKAFSVAGGSVYDGPVPEAFPLAVALEAAGCQLLKPSLPFCSEACGGDAVCVADETCAAYPKPQNVGVLQVDGLVGSAASMEPFPPSFAYQSASLPHPPCVEGDEVTLSADGFHASASCVAPLIVTNTEFPVRREQALELTWEPPAEPDQTRILIKLDVSHHGGKKGEVDCDIPDTGSFEIPASLVTALIDLGLAGYPTIVLTRTAAGAASEQPDVKFEISSGVEREVDTGIISCTDDAQCPTDQSCNMDKLVCE
ncbi:MAG TPA: hypothetical protein VHP33_31445 [Polyangiaceae bacterium]|nr:hypothetical protein [Polyangiaceae bacterium]